MKKYILFAFLLAIAVSSIIAGDKPSIYITGNRTVDFFGVPRSFASAHEQNTMLNFKDALQQEERSEKSPWLAGLLSAAVPGAGEFYSGSYIKAGIFFGIEIATYHTESDVGATKKKDDLFSVRL